MAIKRVWHGWTTPDNAESYRRLLHEVVFAQIEAKDLAGYLGIELLSRPLDDEVEFVTIMTFRSLQDVIDFQGEDNTRCYVPEPARRLLKRWDQHAAHYQTIEARQYGHPS